jgi:hypothetical protein
MNSTKLRMTASTPSRFGMPSCAHAFGMTPATDLRAATLVVRAGIEGTQGAIERGTGFAPSYLPGTSAWRPPTC